MTRDAIHALSHSIVIPTSARPDLLKRALMALADAERPTWECEVVVVDNSVAESDRAANRSVIEAAAFPQIRYESIAPIGLTAARHRGAKVASGDVVSYLDDDSVVGHSWLKGVESAFSGHGAVLVGGPNLPLYECEPPAWLEHFWAEASGVRVLTHLSLLDAGVKRRPISSTLVFGCNLSIRRDVLERSRGCNPDSMPPSLKRFQGDGETALSVKVEALGVHALYEPECAIRHVVPATRLTEQYFRDRSFNFGLEASFTALRAEHGFGPEEGVPGRVAPSALMRVKSLLARGRDAVLGRDGDAGPISPAAAHAGELRAELAECERAGWEFHRQAVAEDPALLAYALRPDYWDPEAWDALA